MTLPKGVEEEDLGGLARSQTLKALSKQVDNLSSGGTRWQMIQKY